jgi:hypothetical protein
MDDKRTELGTCANVPSSKNYKNMNYGVNYNTHNCKKQLPLLPGSGSV